MSTTAPDSTARRRLYDDDRLTWPLPLTAPCQLNACPRPLKFVPVPKPSGLRISHSDFLRGLHAAGLLTPFGTARKKCEKSRSVSRCLVDSVRLVGCG